MTAQSMYEMVAEDSFGLSLVRTVRYPLPYTLQDERGKVIDTRYETFVVGGPLDGDSVMSFDEKVARHHHKTFVGTIRELMQAETPKHRPRLQLVAP